MGFCVCYFSIFNENLHRKPDACINTKWTPPFETNIPWEMARTVGRAKKLWSTTPNTNFGCICMRYLPMAQRVVKTIAPCAQRHCSGFSLAFNVDDHNTAATTVSVIVANSHIRVHLWKKVLSVCSVLPVHDHQHFVKVTYSTWF